MKSLLTSEPHRELTNAEKTIVAQLKPKEGVKPEVYYLEGEFTRYGISSSQGGEVWHDAIGGVEVELPYSSRLFLTQSNKAEVIAFDKKKMLVISLNEQFTLIEGYEVDQIEQSQNKQWQQGTPGEIKDDTLLNYVTDNQLGDGLEHQLKYKIINNREETQAEREYRYHPGFKILASIFLAIGFGCLIQADFNQTSGQIFGLVSLVTFILGLFLLIKNKKLQEPKQVNLVQGVLYQDDDSNVYLGGNKLIVPAGWENRLELSKRERIYDITTDYHLLRANELSIDQAGLKQVFWGKHVLPALVGIIAVIIGLGTFNQIKADWYYTLNFIKGDTPKTYASVADFNNHPPKAGTLIKLKGSYRCWLDKEDGEIENNCNIQLYGTDKKLAEPLKLDSNIQKLSDTPWFEKAHLSVFAKMYLMELAKKRHGYVDFNSLLRFAHPVEFIQLIDKVCESNLKDCKQIKSEFSDLIHADNWDEAKKMAASGKKGLFKRSSKSNLEYDWKQIKDEYAKDLRDKLLTRLYQQTHQGVLISLTPFTGVDDSSWRYSRYQPWKSLLFNQKLAVGEIATTPQDNEVIGIVSSAQQHHPIEINNRYSYPFNQPNNYLITIIFMFLATILAIWQIILLIWRLNKKDKQLTA
ncbi:IgaA/UmoB family intracellular growth attenuator [Celerinatantimonas sp. MCCC 1A17872]|uniref:IgaA/UmoB family intracellular growth attenuator n=1 Tax=Celerinatantimonas sp. MCCC 1A17872 TaxID=3177514 RepID=UPI0038C38842